MTIEKVVVHPLVLLSVVDHYHRVAKDTKRRVVGVLLGEVSRGVLDVTNCFAVPFEEDEQDPSVWFMDHSYLENMYAMFKKINARERIVGWYSTGPRLRECDGDVQSLLQGYCEDPVLVICEVAPKIMGLPVHAYVSKEEIHEGGSHKTQRVFANLPTEVGASEAEEVGVEHLLRDVKDATVSTLAAEVSGKVTGMRGLSQRLSEIREYLEHVVNGRLPVNHDIMYMLQDVFNLLPNLNTAEMVRSFTVKSNDMMLTMYLGSLIRSVLALHGLINNKEVKAKKERDANRPAPPVTALDTVKEAENTEDKTAASG